MLRSGNVNVRSEEEEDGIPLLPTQSGAHSEDITNSDSPPVSTLQLAVLLIMLPPKILPHSLCCLIYSGMALWAIKAVWRCKNWIVQRDAFLRFCRLVFTLGLWCLVEAFCAAAISSLDQKGHAQLFYQRQHPFDLRAPGDIPDTGWPQDNTREALVNAFNMLGNMLGNGTLGLPPYPIDVAATAPPLPQDFVAVAVSCLIVACWKGKMSSPSWDAPVPRRSSAA